LKIVKSIFRVHNPAQMNHARLDKLLTDAFGGIKTRYIRDHYDNFESSPHSAERLL
jgi:hypothetical protein